MRPGVFGVIGLLLMASLVGVAAVGAESARRGSPNPTKSRVSLNNYYLEEILRQMTEEVEGQEGQWSFELYDVSMMLISDESADRMRIIAPVNEVQELDAAQLMVLLEANFDRALDAKYAVWNGMVWSTFAHPLSDLTENELKSAIRQVANLKRNYGTSFSSTEMLYGVSPAPDR